MNDWYPRMIAILQLNGKGEPTQKAYTRAVRMLSEFYEKTPDLVSEPELQEYHPRTDSRANRIKLRFRCRSVPPRARAAAPQCLPNLWRVAEIPLCAAPAQDSAPLRIKESAQPDNRLAVRLCGIELKSERWRRSALTLPMVSFRFSLLAANSRRK